MTDPQPTPEAHSHACPDRPTNTDPFADFAVRHIAVALSDPTLPEHAAMSHYANQARRMLHALIHDHDPTLAHCPLAASTITTTDLAASPDPAAHAATDAPTVPPGDQTCQSTSPESRSRCALPDTADAHDVGHAAAYVNGSRACWATRPTERARWASRHQ